MITKELLERLCPTAGLNPRKYNLVAKRDELVLALNKFMPAYGIDTKRRVDAALSCWGIETDYFRTTEEYASGAAYEGRTDLGNTERGDGKRFKGRGVTQITGRYNYRKEGFEDNPEALNDIPTAVETACKFWRDHNLNQYADAKQIKQLNSVVNRGTPNKTPLGWAKRNELYSKCFRYTPENIFANVPAPSLIPSLVTPTPQPLSDLTVDTAQATLQSPSLKTVAGKIGTRVGGPLSATWACSTGKVLIVLSGFILLAGIGYTAYIYRKHIQLGWEIAVLTFKKKVGLS